ncbi:PLP-dependent transferase [Atractiella rhizophila]|nr:PLP-dependent transferase [Atractiella rhizophila]
MNALDPIKECHPAFPTLNLSKFIYADAAGGSHILQSSIDALTDYLIRTNVQLGAGYKQSTVSTERVMNASTVISKLMGCDPEEVTFGSSSTQLCHNLAKSVELGGDLQEGDEFVLSEQDHEANINPWIRLAQMKGITVKFWKIRKSPYVHQSTSDLALLLNEKTRLVAFTACSNILGGITPIRDIVDLVKEKSPRAQTCIDCVAYAPHRQMKFHEWGVSFGFFTLYKVYGPHAAAAFVSSNEQRRLGSLAHYFNAFSIQPNPAYELAHASTAIVPYLESLATSDSNDRLASAFERIADHEQSLMDVILGFLSSTEGITVIGNPSADKHARVPTISFIVQGQRSEEIVQKIHDSGEIGCRNGHAYAHRLLTGLDPDDGVVRISLVHYNTVDEAKRIVEILKEVIKPK